MPAPERSIRFRSGVLLLKNRKTNRHGYPLQIVLAADVAVGQAMYTLRRHRHVPTTTRGGQVVPGLLGVGDSHRCSFDELEAIESVASSMT